MNHRSTFHSIDELCFQISSAASNYSLPDQILHDPVPVSDDLPASTNDSKGSIDEMKKWMHRETEKQRRQQVSKLFTTFRSLLPLEYIKGKRSSADHMHEGTNYIKHLQNKVKKLQDKKDELKKLSNFNHVDTDESGRFTIYVVVHPCLGGVQIKCSYSFKKHAFPLSRVLDIVIKEGLNVINCISTKTDDDRFIHTIQSEEPHWMDETKYIELQRKLMAAISSSSN